MAATLPQKIDETFDQLDNIDTLCGLFFNDRKHTIYKSIAASLRLLLPGSSGHCGLAQDVLPAGTLLPLSKVPDSSVPTGHIMLPAKALIESGEAKITLGNGTVYVQNLNVFGGAVGKLRFEGIFDSAASRLPILEWLAQPFLRPEWTLKKFISTVTNKDGGAHLDPDLTLLAMQQFGHIHWLLTAEIARSISPQIKSQLCATYPSHVRPVR